MSSNTSDANFADLPAGGPERVSARGTSAVGAGHDASHNATGRGSTVNDNRRLIVNLGGLTGPACAPLSPEAEISELDAYARQIRSMYGRLDLEVLIPTTEGEHPRVELREVFVPPMLRADPPPVELPVELHRRLAERGELPSTAEETPSVPGLDREMWVKARETYRERPKVPLLETLAAAESGRLVLLGDPGAGKSTLARYLALSLTSRALSGPLAPLAELLPVVIELRRYADADWRERTFEDFLAHLYEQERRAPHPALLRSRLADGRALVVFDGLDELFDPGVRNDVTHRITGFAERYPAIRIAVTSRVIGYRAHALDSAGFRHYMIQSLDDDQIAEFARRWYETVCPADKAAAERLHGRLCEAIDVSRPVRELAGNPLLLTILAIIARRQRLPRDRAGVYQHAVNVLIAHWDEDTKHLNLTPEVCAIADLDDRDRREMLEHLARHMQNGESGIAGNQVLGEDVEQVFTTYMRETLQLDLAPAKKVARAMVKQFRERNFILSRYGSEVYGFVHRAFLEYLAASDIVRRYGQRDLSDEELLDDVFAQRAHDSAWHEVLLLVVGQIGERVAGRAVDTILSLKGKDEEDQVIAGTRVLALRALAEVRRVGLLEAQSVRTAKALTEFGEEAGYVRPRIESDIKASFALLGHQWAGRRHVLRWLLTTEDSKLSSAALSMYTDKDVLAVVASRSCYPALRIKAYRELVRQHPSSGTVRELVQNVAAHERNTDVRSAAIAVLATRWTEDAAVRGLVLDAARDPSAEIRGRVIGMLAGCWSQDPTVRDLIEDLASHDPDNGVRSRAIGELAARWPQDPTVRGFIEDLATHDPNADVRSEALGTLIRHWCDGPGVREFVFRSMQDLDTDIGDTALAAFSFYYRDQPATLGLIRNRAAYDPRIDARSAALTTLALDWVAHPATRRFLRDLATHDPSPGIRGITLVFLALLQPQDCALRDFIQDRAVYDPSASVRGELHSTLARRWGRDLTVRDFFRDRAAHDPDAGVRSRARDALVAHLPAEPTVQEQVKELRERACRHDAPGCPGFLTVSLSNSPHPEVRVTAARLLGALWSADRATVPALRAQAAVEEDEGVREQMAAAITMAEGYAPVHDRLF
ncbi:NACHT domain-containing protein [Streptomyces odontomachi]|uniref:NACHT domain-containing protein n=1 Tax=Streptomyces odontomachi TaxID=2944940 RepID=UPI00210C355C|nr:HEAT repeat domain-containing protein [Streptomyces sp. ODS25]